MSKAVKCCSVQNCGRAHLAKGFCILHYRRWQKYGDPLADLPRQEPNKGNIRKHPLYSAWAGMLNRCRNPRNSNYPMYGGRGIEVCQRWRDFRNFLNDMGERPKGMTLDRIDPDGPYAPWNCRWASLQTQRANWSELGKQRQREATRGGAIKRWDKFRQERAAEV